ncbi:MAG: riboflavin kinase, partial [Candidatus Puniceispirillaceae bacterium]
GRLLDFPTANLGMQHYLHPAFGVYAVTAWLPDRPELGVMRGVCNIGQRPTVNNRGVLAEAHLFEFDEDIYGQRLTLALFDYIRTEQKFPSLDELKDQIEADCNTARQIFKKIDADSFAS